MKPLFLLIILSFAATSLRSQSIVLDTTSDVCGRLKTNGHGLVQVSQWKPANDTLRLYIEDCANQSGSFHEFTELNSAVQFMSNDNNRWLDYRTWLKKVLYLSPDSLYYCGDARAILHTFQYMNPDIDFNGQAAVIDYLLKNNRCPEDSAYLLTLRKSGRDEQVRIWRDTVKDSTKTPIDTGTVTLESRDLQILKGLPNAVTPSPIHSATRIASFTASDNPFNSETTLRYDLNEATLVKVEIFDALGKVMYSSGDGLKNAGEHTVRVDGKIYPTGTYYARLSTFSGEFVTIKLERVQ